MSVVLHNSVEWIVCFELDEVMDCCYCGVGLCLPNTLRVDIDSYTVSTIFFCGGNHNTPVATAKVIHGVRLCHVR